MKYKWDILSKIIHSPRKKLEYLMSNYTGYINEVNRIKKDYNVIDNINFNIFTSVSNTYYKENYHSDIIKYILDPNTEKIGNNNFVSAFFNFIHDIEPKVKLNICKDIYIEREMNKIDLFLYDENKYGIIIENKINWAKDQPDQLGKYYKKMSMKGYNIDAIIYLTLTPEKELDVEYSIKDKNIRQKILNKTKKVSVINYRNELSFANNFIDTCTKLASNDYQRIYLSEYSELIKYLGGKYMSNTIDKQTLIEIYENKEKFNAFNIFGNLWSRKKELLNEIIFEKLKDELNFIVHPEDKNTLFKKIKEGVNISFHRDFSFGFVNLTYKKKMQQKLRTELKKIFMQFISDDKFFKEDDIEENDHWIYKTVDWDRIGVIDKTISKFIELEKYFFK